MSQRSFWYQLANGLWNLHVYLSPSMRPLRRSACRSCIPPARDEGSGCVPETVDEVLAITDRSIRSLTIIKTTDPLSWALYQLSLCNTEVATLLMVEVA